MVSHLPIPSTAHPWSPRVRHRGGTSALAWVVLPAVVWALGGPPVRAQVDEVESPAPDTVAVEAPPEATVDNASPPSESPGNEVYAYRPAGRRDPFVSLISRGVAPRVRPVGPIAGLGGLLVEETSLRGVLRSRGQFIAMIEGPDGKTHLAHVDDELLDGVITRITTDAVVILQEVDDPLSPVAEREIRRRLRSLEDEK